MKLLTAIIFTAIPQPVSGNKFLKYRGIKNTPWHKEKFLRFAEKFPGAMYVNWYDKQTKAYIERTWIVQPNQKAPK